ncbi:MAG TPA: hypothetical protein VNK41_04345 [Vicinamibacterales bacterium]|nr:hypothetical protein [Vicinamibacterales bacterium]
MPCASLPGRWTSRTASAWLTALALFTLAFHASTAAQMPDPRAMSGMAVPSADLPDGTVTVRVVRGSMANNLEGVSVELHGAGEVRRAATGADGRATFTGLPAGATVQARAVVDGEVLVSSNFPVPSQGGVRTLLAASPEAAGGPTPPAAEPRESTQPSRPPGTSPGPPVALGPNSRIAIEFSNDILQVFYLFEVVNRSGGPVPLDEPLVFDLPDGALGVTLLEGSTPQATAEHDRVLVTGTLPPGPTDLSIGFRLEPGGGDLTLWQAFPIPTDTLLLAVQKIGAMQVSSPQLTRIREAPIQNVPFIVGSGPALEAGMPLVLTVSGLPHHSRTPLWIALTLVGVIVASGIWLAAAGNPAADVDMQRRQLEAARERGLAALAALEAERRAGCLDQRTFEERRAPLLASLERVYADLDAVSTRAVERGAAA